MEAPTRILKQTGNKTPVETVEKDEVELRLEKALFGDDAGFLASLTRSDAQESNARSRRADDALDQPEADYGEQLSDLADDDLFFIDAGTGSLPPSISKALEQSEQPPGFSRREPTWYDSDDDRITVSLASNPRLRKLRETAEDDVVDGRQYIQRLRWQYERLHPEPEWVTYARKKRRLSPRDDDEEDQESDSDVSMDDGESLPSAQPLSELLRTAGSLTRSADPKKQGHKGPRKLRSGVIDIQRAKDVSSSGPSSVDTLQFHPYYPLLLAGGPSSTATLYHISPETRTPNPILTSLHLQGTPLHTAAFCASLDESSGEEGHDQTRIFLSSRRRYFHSWSLSTGSVSKVTRALYGDARKEQRTMESFKISPCGRYMGLIGSSKKGGGSVNVLSTKTMQWICSCRIDSRGGVADFAWWRDGNGFAVVGKNGEVSEYDIEARAVVWRWIDEGAVGTTVIALGGDLGKAIRGGSRWVAVGSSSGVVNLYDRRGWLAEATGQVVTDHRPQPARVLDQLVTPISHLEFSDDGQMLVMSSRWKKNALRLIHLPSCSVFSNWPTDKTPFGRISAIALSRDGGYLAVGNDQGQIRLWEIAG